jgi:signal transduction histidine kinase
MARLRDPLLLAACALAGLSIAVSGFESLAWIGRPFPGFLLLENRVVASAGLSDWPATRDGGIYQHEVVAVDGAPLEDALALQKRVAALEPGSQLDYRLHRGEEVIERRIATRLFTGLDYALLFGAYLFCGTGLVGIALGIRFLRGRDVVATASMLSLFAVGMYAVTAADLYGPYRLFRLHAFFECFLFAGALHMALVFPQPGRLFERAPWLVRAGYGSAAILVAAMQFGLQDPAAYAALHRVAVSAFGAGLVLFILAQVAAWWWPPSFAARQRVKVVVLGTLAALTPQVVLVFMSALTGGQAPENAMVWSGIFFPISIGYAVLHDDLFEVDALLRRTLNYALLTLGVAAGYAAALAAFESIVSDSSAGNRASFVMLFAVVSVIVILPARDGLQAVIDRIFFRSAYDFRRLVETASARLSSVVDLEVIAAEIERTVDEALHPEWLAFEVGGPGSVPPRRLRSRGPLPPPLASAGAVDGELPFDLPAGGLAVPLRVEDRCVATLRIGRRLSGGFYGGDDRRLLHTLANQGAVAVENALALEAVRELNRGLEDKVAARTAELAAALRELQQTQAQLVHREKMASVGQLVAGVAHEINNPLFHIQGNLHHLREYAETLQRVVAKVRGLAAVGDPELAREVERLAEEHDLGFLLEDMASAFAACDEGVARTTTIVRDLKTFSRLDLAERSRLDLREALESTLGLLRTRLAGIRVATEYASVPPVECLAGQINQVLMNLITNAADAAPGGKITIRTLAPDPEHVAIEVEDDGTGIAPAHLGRIFEPFFTTKSVGQGTGLGLAITWGVVARHGGRIDVRSQPGEGSCFRVLLPVVYRPPDADEPGSTGNDRA